MAKGEPSLEKGEPPSGRNGDIQNKFKQFTEDCKTMTDVELIDNHPKLFA